ncbi:MAG: UbiX family flavin prenyltransferase [Chloroflexi bacterium]|nr:MAG: UbiX family flavin prenyltransferase [Chloroflexota bacterium]MBL1196434.1 UbiX family flavin prenyltransferase [Chloroflexota bacterium]NOH13729.1 UbiX family flavin prenyltransferase [Chloroflexota bacterium]
MITKRLIIGITGGSGAILGIRMLEHAKALDIETHLVISQAAKLTIQHETDWRFKDVLRLADVAYKNNEVGATIASGSFMTAGMVVLPCSIKTLSAIANSYADNLITRAADVTLKEGRNLVLAVRETPLHAGHLDQMSQAARIGAVIYPPVPAFYAQPKSIDDIVDNLVGRIFMRLGIENEYYKPWDGLEDS